MVPMAAKDKERGEKSGLVSFWVNVLVLGIVMVVLGFYLGTYMLEVWKSDDIGGVQDFTASDLGDVRGESTLSDLGSSAPATSSPSQSSAISQPQQPGQTATQSAQSSAVTATSSGLYKVQVGSFDDRAAAEALAGQLKRLGYTDAWVTSTLPHRVQVGAYSNPDNASKVVNELESSGYSVFIVN